MFGPYGALNIPKNVTDNLQTLEEKTAVELVQIKDVTVAEVILHLITKGVGFEKIRLMSLQEFVDASKDIR